MKKDEADKVRKVFEENNVSLKGKINEFYVIPVTTFELNDFLFWRRIIAELLT